MKLLFRREVLPGMSGKPPKFLVHARMQVTPEESELIDRFGLSLRELYAWTPRDIRYRNEQEMHPLTQSVTVGRLTSGYEMRFTDFVEMLDAEASICRKAEELAHIFEMAEQFQQEEVVEF
jgi:hypothetical protein